MKQYYYDFIDEDDVDEGDVGFYVVDVEFYKNTGYISDRHIWDDLLKNLEDPETFDKEFFEDCESYMTSLNFDKQRTEQYLESLSNFTKKKLSN